MSSIEQEVKRLYVTMSDRPPVSIDPREWPQIAMGDWGDNAPNPPNRRWTIRVREHADGRVLVYGRYVTLYRGEDAAVAGYLIGADEDVVAMIRRVGDEIDAPEYRVIHRCIESLPTERL